MITLTRVRLDKHRIPVIVGAVLIAIAWSLIWPLFTHITVINKRKALHALKLEQIKNRRGIWMVKDIPVIQKSKERTVITGDFQTKNVLHLLNSSKISQKANNIIHASRASETVVLPTVEYRNNSLVYEYNNANIVTSDLYDVLPFDNFDGGVWKQGFPITTSDEEWKGKKLKVFVVPHSHNDPGWIKTVDQYFNDETKYILNNVVDYLSENKNRRFVWAEISFLSMWVNTASPERQLKLKTLLHNGQLEIVTGGWVMNDEANTHYFAIIDQMIEGNEWLKEFFGIIPVNGWSIDPFGHSSVMSYLLKKMKFENMVIQRTHYALKMHFALQQSLEFRWKQFWKSQDDDGILCHMMPFFSYDIPHTCGPDPAICCQFDFARLSHMRYSCPWNRQPLSINDKNVKKRSITLLDQYRKKAKLFRTNVVLVPLGDDFRYSSAAETKIQFENYERLFEHINSNPHYNAKIQFGTLSEYFNEMRSELGDVKKLPSLIGDFFTYADRDDHYWSGYYVTRPFYKRQERVLEAYLRGAGILYALAIPYANISVHKKTFTMTYYKMLVKARRNLALFQHHDGITGTSRVYVVKDYADRLKSSIVDAQKVLASSAQLLLSPRYEDRKFSFNFDEIYSESHQLPKRKGLKITKERTYVVIYNSLSYVRKGIVSLFVSSTDVAVLNSDDKQIFSQIKPVWVGLTERVNDRFQLDFVAVVPALGLTTYTLSDIGEKTTTAKKVDVSFFNLPLSFGSFDQQSFQIKVVKQRPINFILENKIIRANFSSQTGFLSSILDKKSGYERKTLVTFKNYFPKTKAKQTSGAYIFYPDDDRTTYHNPVKPLMIRVVRGVLYSEIFVQLRAVIHRVRLLGDAADLPQQEALYIRNFVQLTNRESDFEISMRIASNVNSTSYFYTDLNGFQIVRRKTYKKLPIQGNFYPMPTIAFIQDATTRLTLLTAQPLGVASLMPGELEVLLDRRLPKDDLRGLGRGINDNVPTAESFVLLLERWELHATRKWNSSIGYPSIFAQKLSWELLHPLNTMSLDSKEMPTSLQRSYSPLNQHQWPCDIHLVNLRTLPVEDQHSATDQAALLLHRVGYESSLTSHRQFNSCYSHGYDVLMESLPIDDVKKTLLSLQHDHGKANLTLPVAQMEVEAFKVKLVVKNMKNGF